MGDGVDKTDWFPPRPIPPMFPVPSPSSSFPVAMERIQTFINSFQYNYTNNPFVKPKKTGGSRHIVEIFQLLVDLSLPIQCVEAVFISAVLSAPFREVVRIPLSFESKCEGHLHKHIVLAVLCDGQWGAMGISRRDSLMYKPLQHPTLWSLIEEYDKSYQAVGHIVTLVAPGSPLPYDFTTRDFPIFWKAAKLRLGARLNAISKLELESFLQLHGLSHTSISSSNKSLRKRSHSHTGAATTQISDNSQQPHHSHHSKLGPGKASYKAIVMGNAITTVSVACVVAEDANSGNITSPTTGDSLSKPPRPQLAHNSATEKSSASTLRGKARATSLSSSSSMSYRMSFSPPQHQHLPIQDNITLTSVSQPSTARNKASSEHVSPFPHQEIIETENLDSRSYAKNTILANGGIVHRRKFDKEKISEKEPIVAVDVVITAVKVKTTNSKSQSSFLPPISHIRTTPQNSAVVKTSRL